MPLSPVFRAVSYNEVPGWAEDRHGEAFAAFRRSAAGIHVKPYRSGSLGLRCEAFAPAYADALQITQPSDTQARDFFEQHFTPARVCPAEGSGLVTGFYEPVALASPVRTERFRFPLLARPDDLVDVDDSNRPAGIDPYFAFARRTATGLVEYHDRRAIESGSLDAEKLAIAWLESRVDVFFIHVQGAACLNMVDGGQLRVTYAAKTGHPFTGIGRVLADLGEIPLRDVTMQSIRAWLAANPNRHDDILWRNRSYIFFKQAPVDDPDLGPIAAAKVQLTPERSMAVDRLLHTFGTPFFVDAPELTAFDGKPFRRLMIAQDTGSAIVGAARGDLFAGSGAAAGEIAGVVRFPADFYALVPRTLAEGAH